MIEFTIEGNPIPLERVRTSGKKRFFTAKAEAYRNLVLGSFLQLYGRQDKIAEPARVRVVIHCVREDRRRCDVDNIAKAILDALNGWAFDDDSQVDELAIIRTHGEPGFGVACVSIDEIKPPKPATSAAGYAKPDYWREDPA